MRSPALATLESLVSLTSDQLEEFVRSGYLILRNVVPRPIVEQARKTYFRTMGAALGDLSRVIRFLESEASANQQVPVQDKAKIAADSWRRLGQHDDILGLVEKRSEIRTLIENSIGEPVRGFEFAQIATQFPAEPSKRITEAGYPDHEIPFHGWHGHLDGLWNGATPPHQHTNRPMSMQERQAWSQDRGTNGVMRTYPDTGANLTNFTALLGIPLSNQVTEGAGNLGLLPGAHHHIQDFFKLQRENGGPLGPDGPHWERIHVEAPNGCGLRHYPDQVREQYSGSATFTQDGRCWPKPDLIKVELGDAVLTLYAVPHGATRCEASNPRVVVYFRLTNSCRPDRFKGNFVAGLCDNWLEWKGIRNEATDICNASA